MRILVITQKADRNDDVLGFFHEWIRRFAKTCESVEVIALYEGSHDLPANVRVHSLGKEKDSSRLSRIATFYKLVWSLRDKYDGVFVHMNPEYLMLAGVLWRVWGKKSALWYVHKHVSLRLRIGALWANTIFTVSPESFRLKGVEARGKIVITGHGIDTDAFVPAENVQGAQEDFIITSIGRISPVKGYDMLIDALKLLPKTVGKVSEPTTTKCWHCQILGSAGTPDQVAYETRIKQRVKNEGLSERVRFVGAVPNRDIIPYLQESSVFVNLSGTGSVDKAVLEAMSVGVPSITSNEAFVPILNHAVPDHAATLICPSKSVEALAERLETLMNTSEAIRRSLGHRLRDTVVNDHNLNTLIGRITRVMSESKP